MTPAPHARKRPNITISQLEALRRLADPPGIPCRPADRGVMKALVTRGLAIWADEREDSLIISRNGRALIDTQYEALKKILPDTRSQSR
jgi:hypothetical protein